eukprot:6451762-Amphidinium_carterae.2
MERVGSSRVDMGMTAHEASNVCCVQPGLLSESTVFESRDEIEHLRLPLPACRVSSSLNDAEMMAWESKWTEISRTREPSEIKSSWLSASEMQEILPQDITEGMEPYIDQAKSAQFVVAEASP